MDFWSGIFDSVQGDGFLEENGCPVCGPTKARRLRRLGPAFLLLCRGCGLVYSSPRLSDRVRDQMYRLNPGAMTPGLNVTLESLMDERLRTMLREMLPPLSQEPASLFEIGCGWGHFLKASGRHFHPIAGAELSREQAAHARTEFGLDISEEDIFKGDLAHPYDCIAAWELLEHLPDPRRFLAWTLANLSPGGQLVLSTPNYASLYRRLLGTHWFYFIPTQHLSYFSPRTLRALLLEVGFTEVKTCTSGRSLFSERWNDHNQVDDRAKMRDQWLQSLRIRASIECQREGTNLNRRSPIKRLWHGMIWHLINPLVTGGFGDQMRVYARKAS